VRFVGGATTVDEPNVTRTLAPVLLAEIGVIVTPAVESV
jgi:hypothetical protein